MRPERKEAVRATEQNCLKLCLPDRTTDHFLCVRTPESHSLFLVP